MSVKFTPGPWSDKSIDGSQWGVYAADGTPVGQAYQVHPYSYDPLQAERTANARLIAAAPELLEALQEAAERLQIAAKHTEDLMALVKADKAIRKATGEQP